MLRTVALITIVVAFITTQFFVGIAHAVPSTNRTINFQGRLLTASGAVVADGHYNMQFKIYQGGSGTAAGNPDGSLKWTETYVNNGGSSGVDVRSGFFSVSLGSQNPFGSSVDWDQDTLWLSMNVAGSATDCTAFNAGTCVADGEMLPMKRITATPYALNAGAIGGKTADNFVQLAQGVQTDASTNTSSIFINKTGTGNLIQLQNTASDVFTVDSTGNLTLGSSADKTISIATSAANTVGRNLTVAAGGGGSGTGSAGGSLVLQGGAAGGTNGNGGNIQIDAGSASGTGSDGAIAIGTTHASAISLGRTSANTQVTINGTTTIKQVTESTNAFSVTSHLDNKVLTVDTQNGRVGIGQMNKSTPTLDGFGLEIQGALRLSGGAGTIGDMTDVFTTPIGSSVRTKINIPLYDPGAYGQILALGLPSTADPTSRVLSMFDARTTAHQPTLGVFSPDENNLIGFSWDGSNDTAAVKNTANKIALQGGGKNILTAVNSGGAATVGIGNAATSGYALDVTGDVNSSTQYRIGGSTALTGSSLNFSSASTSTIAAASGQTLKLTGDGGIQLGDGTSGITLNGSSVTVQGGVTATGLDTATAGTLNIGTATATGITIGNATTNGTNTIYGSTIMKAASSADSAVLFQLQRADGSVMFTANSTDQTITIGNPITGDKTVISTANGQVTYYGSARHTKKISLSPEYTNSVLDAGTGSNNTGTMTSSLDLTNRMTYYKWTTTQSTNQSYDVVVQVPLPTDFDGWANSNPLAITSYTSDTTNGTVSLEVRDSTNTVRCNFASVTPATTGVWSTNNTACTLNTGVYTPGDYITLRIRLQSPQGGDVRIGNINLSYLSKY